MSDATPLERICVTCQNWQADSFHTLEPAHRTGECNVLQHTLDISLRTGWEGGYVETVETPGDFGCNKWMGDKQGE